MSYRKLPFALLVAVAPLLGCSGSEPPAAPVSQEEVDDLELDLDSGVEATPDEATNTTEAE